MGLLALNTLALGMDEPLVYEGTKGPGTGKHIVMLASDHEYRTEESAPAIARILAKRFGFKCTVLFGLDPETGFLMPGNSHMPGTEALADADLMLITTRFLDLPAEQMRPIADYVDRGGPVVGWRTATHAFNIKDENAEFYRFHFRYPGEEYEGGFGRQVLGETWAGHYGKNHVQSTILDIVDSAKAHPILTGVSDVWVQAGAYTTNPMPNSTILAMAQPLNGMTIDSPRDATKPPTPGIWVRTYKGKNGVEGRVFTTTYGASEDILNDGFRRLMINGIFWSLGMENEIKAKSNVEFVGPYNPVTFRFGGYRQGVKPQELSGWESSIMPTDKIIEPRKPKKKK